MTPHIMPDPYSTNKTKLYVLPIKLCWRNS